MVAPNRQGIEQILSISDPFFLLHTSVKKFCQ